jgi:hypothetical protein
MQEEERDMRGRESARDEMEKGGKGSKREEVEGPKREKVGE